MMQDTVPLGPDFEPVPPQKPKLSDIVHECGTIERLYYASTEVHHIGREDVGLPPDKQRAREQIADVAMKLLDNGMEKRIATLKQMLSVERDQLVEENARLREGLKDIAMGEECDALRKAWALLDVAAPPESAPHDSTETETAVEHIQNARMVLGALHRAIGDGRLGNVWNGWEAMARDIRAVDRRLQLALQAIGDGHA
jgi:hypothetical protein